MFEQRLVKLRQLRICPEQSPSLVDFLHRKPEIASAREVFRSDPTTQSLFKHAQFGCVDKPMPEPADDLLSSGSVAGEEDGAKLSHRQAGEHLTKAITAAMGRVEQFGLRQIQPSGVSVLVAKVAFPASHKSASEFELKLAPATMIADGWLLDET
jgi:hypothetical protein